MTGAPAPAAGLPGFNCSVSCSGDEGHVCGAPAPPPPAV